MPARTKVPVYRRFYALPRYAECKQVPLDEATFVSSDGVALNAVTNRAGQGTTLFSDGEDHTRRRSLLALRITPGRCASCRTCFPARPGIRCDRR